MHVCRAQQDPNATLFSRPTQSRTHAVGARTLDRFIPGGVAYTVIFLASVFPLFKVRHTRDLKSTTSQRESFIYLVNSRSTRFILLSCAIDENRQL